MARSRCRWRTGPAGSPSVSASGRTSAGAPSSAGAVRATGTTRTPPERRRRWPARAAGSRTHRRGAARRAAACSGVRAGHPRRQDDIGERPVPRGGDRRRASRGRPGGATGAGRPQATTNRLTRWSARPPMISRGTPRDGDGSVPPGRAEGGPEPGLAVRAAQLPPQCRGLVGELGGVVGDDRSCPHSGGRSGRPSWRAAATVLRRAAGVGTEIAHGRLPAAYCLHCRADARDVRHRS